MRVRKLLIIAFAIFLVSFVPEKKKITVWLCGDSTMSIKDPRYYPETGWGMPFANFFDSTVAIENRAKNGRSTKTFISEKLWQSVVDNAKEGDYVFIQFGHNDEAKEKVERFTTAEEYRANLLRFVSESRSKKAQPILLTPVTRRRFDANGNILGTHDAYSAIVCELAATEKVPLIDLDKKSQELLQQFGKDNSKWLFLQLQPGEHPNYPNGRDDNTHFNELGARLVAQLVLKEIRNLNLELVERVRPSVVK